MARKTYIGIGERTKLVSRMYVGVGDEARKVLKCYIGDSEGKARVWHEAVVTFAGRKIYRHPTLPGSVVEYNEFGTDKKLLVVDAAYRGRTQWRDSDMDISGIRNWMHKYYPTCTSNKIDDSTGSVDLSRVQDLSPYEDKLTDAHFQEALTYTLKTTLQTAKVATGYMVAAGDCQAAQFCRSRAAGIELQIPNIYQLLVMYASGDAIDNFDPTTAAYPNNALGYIRGFRWRSGGGSNTWSSTERSSLAVCAMNQSGNVTDSYRYYTGLVAPVAEI